MPLLVMQKGFLCSCAFPAVAGPDLQATAYWLFRSMPRTFRMPGTGVP